MDIQSQKSYLFLHDRFLSACGSELCFFLNHSLTHGQRSRTGHSMMTRKWLDLPRALPARDA
jgi:hypothetical protein